MVKIWEKQLFNDRPYEPNYPIDKDLWFQWCQYLFDDKSIPSSELSFNINDDIRNNDYFEGELIPVVSEKIKNILTNQVPELVDFFSIKIFENSKAIEVKQFFIIKVKNEIECFDWNKSNYKVSTLKNGIKRIRAIHSLVLNEDKIKDQIIFKISEVDYFLVGVREDLCQKILESGAKGIKFQDLSQVLR